MKRGHGMGGGSESHFFKVFGLGITNFDLLGNYGKIKWLRSYVIILFVNLVFGKQFYCESKVSNISSTALVKKCALSYISLSMSIKQILS